MYKRTGRPTGRPKGSGLSSSLIGQIFARLSVVADAPRDLWGGRQYQCRCECGTVIIARQSSLRTGHVQSCGCLGREILSRQAHKHGDASLGDGTRRRAPEYNVWENMRARCYRAKNKDFKWYGGRGITVCDRWRHSYTHFLADMGRRPTPKHTIERKDNDGPYSPENCIWETMSVNLKNRRYLGRRTGYKRPNSDGQAPYFMQRRDAEGIYYKLIIPVDLPADWRMPAEK